MYIVAMKTYYTTHQKEQASLTRQSYINSGKSQASKNEPLHTKACILYWAEGTKNRNTFGFTNCDAETHKLMVAFLRHYFPDQSKKLKARINFYPSASNTYENVKDYWMKELTLSAENFYNPTDRSKYYKQPKINKYPNGILQLQLGSTEIVHHILGGINHYIGKDIYDSYSL